MGSILSCFIEECERSFRFLETEHGFLYVSGVVDYKKGRIAIRPFPKEATHKNPWLITRYELADRSIEINFYADQSFIEPFFYIGNDRVSWRDLLGTSKKMGDLPCDGRIVSSEDMLQKQIACLAHVLKKNHRIFTEASDKIMERALVMRSMFLEQKTREAYRENLQHISKLAARAFSQQDYHMAVRIYAPYAEYLTTADLKKLNLSRQKIIEKGQLA